MSPFRFKSILLFSLAACIHIDAASTWARNGNGGAPFPGPEVVGDLRRACTRQPDLRGIWIKSFTLDKKGYLKLDMIVDRPEQVALLKKEAAKIIGRVPLWREKLPGGIEPGSVDTLPLVSKTLPALQHELADSVDAPKDKAILSRVRLDDIHYEMAEGTKLPALAFHGVCMLTAGSSAEQARATIDTAIVTLLRKHGLAPKRVSEKFDFSRVLFLRDSAIDLQNALVEHAFDDVLLRKSWYDSNGILKLEGSVGKEERFEQIDRFIRREFVGDIRFFRKEKAPSWSLANVKEVRWPLHVSSVRATARDSGLDLKQVRLDRVFVAYLDKSDKAELRFEGVTCSRALAADKAKQSAFEKDIDALAVKIMPDIAVDVKIKHLGDPRNSLQRRLVRELRIDSLFIKELRYDDDGKLLIEGRVDDQKHLDEVKRFIDEEYGADQRFQPPGKKPAWSAALRIVPWPLTIKSLQRQLASHPEKLFKQTRLDRAYLMYAGDKAIKPTLHIEGVCCHGDALKEPEQEKLKTQIQEMCNERWPDYKELDIPDDISIKPVDQPATFLQKHIQNEPMLDGVRLEKDAAYDAEGKLCLRGIWLGLRQTKALEQLVEQFADGRVGMAFRRGISVACLEAVASDKILFELRGWIAKHLDSALVERLYFDGAGKLQINGFYYDPGDDKKINAKLQEIVKEHPARARLMSALSARNGAEYLVVHESQETHETGGEAGTKPGLTKLSQAVSRHLQTLVAGPNNPKWTGVLIERGYYNADGVFALDGLVDNQRQRDELDQVLATMSKRSEWQPQLARGKWNLKTLEAAPMRAMLVSLKKVMPDYVALDGVRLTGAHQDAGRKLVFEGFRIKEALTGSGQSRFKELLNAEPLWKRRAAAGLELEQLKPVERNERVAELALVRTIELVRKSLPDTLNPICPDTVPPLVPPYRQFLKTSHASLPDDVREACIDYLDIALLHIPNDSSAWFMRALCYVANDDLVSASRDLRRLADLENEDALAKSSRLARLENLQGVLRTIVSDYAAHVSTEVIGGRTYLTLADLR